MCKVVHSRILSVFVFVLLSSLTFFIGCSDASFVGKESVGERCHGTDESTSCFVSCVGGKCQRKFDYIRKSEEIPADVLFVVDNSGSMTAEQEEMATKFPNFLSRLSGSDYRIAVTTTDISSNRNGPRPINQMGNLQDGQLIDFDNNRYFLDGSLAVATEQALFLSTVKRKESLDCKAQNHDPNFCPSGDERGIMAAHLAVQNDQRGFIRSNGKLDVIVLSDEDERSNGGFLQPLVDEEKPDEFVANVRARYPNKSLKFHSIIIQPDDISCFNEQANSGSPAGNFGNTYFQLTELTGGVQGSICADDYGSLLGGIGDSVAQIREALPCRPTNDEITVSFTPQPSEAIEVIKDLDKLEISFSSDIPLGTEIRFEYTCD